MTTRRTARKLLNLLLTTLPAILILIAASSFAAEKIYFYHNDALGSPVAMTDSSGNVVWQEDYKPFGDVNNPSQQQQAANSHQFIGKELDEETGLHYFGARFYDAGSGRFLSVDPVRAVSTQTGKASATLLASSQRLNTYAYSLNNPYRYVDPDGNTPWDLVDIGFFAYSAVNFVSNPSWANAGDLALNAVGLLPLVPSLGTVKVVGNGLNDAGKAMASGTLTKAEHAELQSISDQFNAQIDVIGSRAAGQGRNIEKGELPVGKGPGTRSDIDVRINGQVDIDTRGALSDAIRKAGNGAGSVASSTGLPSTPPVITFKPKK